MIDLVGGVGAAGGGLAAFSVAGSASASGSSSAGPSSPTRIYGILVWRRHGVLTMKDRLATAAIWTGAVIALIALLPSCCTWW